MALGFGTAVLVFIVISAVFTFLVKRFTKNETFFLVSLVRTKRPIPFLDKAARDARLLDLFASLGLFLGFGALAVDFVHGRKLRFVKRSLLFVCSFVVLSALIVATDSFFGGLLSRSVLIGPAFPVVVIAFGLLGFSGFTLLTLLLQAYGIIASYLMGAKSCPGVAPLVPGVQIPGVPITPPLHAWLSLLIILVAHEGMHGILGRRHGFTIKSAGILLFGFIPIGAFVEPDDKELKAAPDGKALPFLSAGPMANLALALIAGIALLVAVAAFSPLTDALYPGLRGNLFSGVRVAGVLPSTSFCGSTYPSPAYGVLMEGDRILEVDGKDVNSLQDFFGVVQNGRFAPREFTVERRGLAGVISRFNVNITPNQIGQFGVSLEATRNPAYTPPASFYYYGYAFSFAADFLYWLVLLNFLVASINFLPMHPFDGGRMAKILFTPYFSFLNLSKEETQDAIEKAFLVAVLALILVNALPLFI